MPSLGAARLYVGDDWQRVVAGLAEESALVIFRPGKTQGFWWEVQHAVAHCDPRRVFLYLPKQDRGRTYASFRRRAAEFFPHPLPLKVGKATFLAFGPEWQPRLLGRGGPSSDASMRWFLGGRAPAVREALNLALGPLGFNAKPMPLHWKEWVGICVLVVLFFQCCCGVLAGLNAR